jgi:hypothetical protein
MTNLYLQYRASTSDPWTGVPDLTSVFPGLAVGALPAQSITIASGPQTATKCGCPGDSADDSYLILNASCPPMPLSLEESIITFLINYKTAAYHEAKYSPVTGAGFGQGGYITALMSLIEAKERNGTLHLSFRLAAAMSDALTNF